MKILVAMEFSGRIRSAFRERGHDAWSCDFLPAEDHSPYHIQGNVFSHHTINRDWDMLIAHPDCTFLTRAGARWQSIPWRAEAMQMGLYTVRALWALPIRFKAIENPPGRLSTLWMPPTQTVQPHWFGEPEFKATCWWLDGLPPLVPTSQLVVPTKGTEEFNRWSKVHWAAPGPQRGKERSRTPLGVAAAIAEQWGAMPQPGPMAYRARPQPGVLSFA